MISIFTAASKHELESSSPVRLVINYLPFRSGKNIKSTQAEACATELCESAYTRRKILMRCVACMRLRASAIRCRISTVRCLCRSWCWKITKRSRENDLLFRLRASARRLTRQLNRDGNFAAAHGGNILAPRSRGRHATRALATLLGAARRCTTRCRRPRPRRRSGVPSAKSRARLRTPPLATRLDPRSMAMFLQANSVGPVGQALLPVQLTRCQTNRGRQECLSYSKPKHQLQINTDQHG